MKDRRRILLGMDGSDQAVDAIRYVSAFFPPRKTEVVLFHVSVEVPEAFLDRESRADSPARDLPTSDWALEAKKRLDMSLEKGEEIFRAAGFPKKSVTAKTPPRQSGIARDFLQEARQGYDAVVIGRSGVSRVPGVVLGSVAHKLVTRMDSVPIGVVCGNPEPKRVLIGFDGSEGSMRAVDCACSLMENKEREVTLCFVVRSLSAHLGDFSIFEPQHEKRWLEISRQEMGTALEEAENRLINAGFHPSHVFARHLENHTSRAAGILAATQDGPSGTVLLGRRGITSIEEFPMGRVPWKVLEMADQRAVWIVP